jgi:hypothetical protein
VLDTHFAVQYIDVLPGALSFFPTLDGRNNANIDAHISAVASISPWTSFCNFAIHVFEYDYVSASAAELINVSAEHNILVWTPPK